MDRTDPLPLILPIDRRDTLERCRPSLADCPADAPDRCGTISLSANSLVTWPRSTRREPAGARQRKGWGFNRTNRNLGEGGLRCVLPR